MSKQTQTILGNLIKRVRAPRVGQVVALGFGLVLLIAFLIGLLGRLAYDISADQRDVIQTRGEVERLALRLELVSFRRTEALNQYLASTNVSFLANYQTYQSAYNDTFSRLSRLLNTPAEQEALGAVVTAETALDDKADEVLRLNSQGFSASAHFLWNSEGEAAQENLLQAIDKLRQVQGNANTAIIDRARHTEQLTVLTISIFAPLLLIGGLVAGFFVTRNITRPIAHLVKTINIISSDLTVRVKPSGPQEIAFLGETVNAMASSLSLSRQALQTHKERLERELTLASRIQNNLLPDTLPPLPGVELAVFRQSARELGGDFFTSARLKDGRYGIAIGDASGKGAPAAMASALAVGLLEAYGPAHSNPESLLAELNNELHHRFNVDRMNIACCYVVFDETLRALTVANAGCVYPYLRRGRDLHEIDAYGMPLGMWPNFNYLPQVCEVRQGDLLLLSSDGLVEAKNERGELFGFKRLETELLNLPGDTTAQVAIDQLVDKVTIFLGQTELHDDLTLVAMRVVGC